MELAFDERVKGSHVSKVIKTEHYEMVLYAGDMEHCFAQAGVAPSKNLDWAELSQFLRCKACKQVCQSRFGRQWW